jgi:hypothetical protein
MKEICFPAYATKIPNHNTQIPNNIQSAAGGFEICILVLEIFITRATLFIPGNYLFK